MDGGPFETNVVDKFRVVLSLILLISTTARADVEAKVSGKDVEPDDRHHDHNIYMQFDSNDGIVIVQGGSFRCHKQDHRAFLMTSDQQVYMGCARIFKDQSVRVIFENGKILRLSKDDEKVDQNKVDEDKVGLETRA